MINMAGLRDTSATLFPGLHVSPGADEMQDGEDKLKWGG